MKRHWLLRYSIAVLTVAIALLLTQEFWVLMRPMISPLFFAAVMFSAWYGGLGPGLLATLLSSLATAYFFVPPTYSFELGVNDVLRLGISGGVALFISSLSAQLQTAKQQAEVNLSQLKASEERYRRLIDTAYEGIWIVDAQGITLYVNQRLTEMLGYAPDEMLDRPFFNFLDDAARIQAYRNFQRYQQGAKAQFDSCYRRKDGSVLWAIVSITPLLDANGKFEGAIAMLTDVTERKQAETALATIKDELEKAAQSKDESLALLNTVLATAPIGLAFVDREFRFVHVNEFLASIDGISQADYLGRSIREVVPNLAPLVEAMWQQILDTGEPVVDLLLSGETPGRPNEQRHCIASYYAVKGTDGQALGIGAVVIDVTERRRAEEEREQLLAREQAARSAAEKANRVKDEFLAVLSHELRTPLNAILGWSRLLQTRQMDATTTARALETIERNARLQTQLIEDILDVSRILRGKLRLQIRPIQLATVIEAAFDAMRLAAETKGVDLQVSLEPAVGSVLGDSDRLQQVIWNLISNAIKFTPAGGQVQVKLTHGIDPEEQVSESGDRPPSSPRYAQVAVSDTGQGISADFLPYVFEHFRQADSTSTRLHGGLGLGLAIVRHLVELHGGTVQAESPGDGLGATFTVRLPLAKDTGAELPNEPDSPLNVTPDPSPLAGLRVLVVDDEADTRDLLTTTLQASGANVAVAASVQEAINVLASADGAYPDLLLSDIGMPEEDGYRLIEWVRSRPAEQGGQIPAVALTAYAREEDRLQVLSAGFQLHVPKPVNPTELVSLVAKLTYPSYRA